MFIAQLPSPPPDTWVIEGTKEYKVPPPPSSPSPSSTLSLDITLVITIIIAIIGAATQLMAKFEQVSTAIAKLQMKVEDIEQDVKDLTHRKSSP